MPHRSHSESWVKRELRMQEIESAERVPAPKRGAVIISVGMKRWRSVSHYWVVVIPAEEILVEDIEALYRKMFPDCRVEVRGI